MRAALDPSLNSENGAYLTDCQFNPGALKPHLQEEVRFHCLRSHSCDFTSRFQGKEERLGSTSSKKLLRLFRAY